MRENIAIIIAVLRRDLLLPVSHTERTCLMSRGKRHIFSADEILDMIVILRGLDPERFKEEYKYIIYKAKSLKPEDTIRIR
jgi:hypothetical protein